MNKAILSGRLCADIELRQTPGGKSVCTFTIAINRRGKDAGADFIDCVAWEKNAEFLSRYFQKGQQVNLCGRLQSRSWEDKDGKKRKATEVVVEEVGFCGGKSEDKGVPEGFRDVSVYPGDDEGLPF